MSVFDPTLCLTVGIAGEPGQLPPSGTPLRLDLCDGDVGQQFALPTAPILPLVPMISVAGLVALCVSLGIVGARRGRSR